MFASLPSPSVGSLEIFSLRFNAYGLMIALGVVAAVWLFKKRLLERGLGHPDDASTIAMVAVPIGIVGARAYHVITDWERFQGRWFDVVKIWEGGLGIWGGITVGVISGIFVARKRGLAVASGLTCVAPGLALAQSIGRWGNWFNQELFGKPTTLPWALEISAAKAQAAGFEAGTTFHPTFLYESLGCLFICVALIKIEKRWRPRDGRLFAMYVAGYTVLRFFVESLRVDSAKHFGGLRLNQWTSISFFTLAVAYLMIDRLVELKPVSNQISQETVVKVSRLARLSLTSDETERMTAQLAGMLEHFRDIDALDLADVEPMTQPYALKNVLRKDVEAPSLDRQEVLDQAPATESGRFRVPPTIGFDV